MSKKYIQGLTLCGVLLAATSFAGNPDRQGEAGANQLLINPWARSAGLHSTNTANTSGIDALYMNVAGVSRINKMQLSLTQTRYLEGADMNINALGFAQKIGKSGALGISLVAFDLGEFELTTTELPEGSGATFSPSFMNIGLSYSHTFSNKVSVGVTAKAVNESLINASARAVALDAGVQYVTGAKDNFKFGISLRNVGGKMRYGGEGLSKARASGNSTFNYPITYYERSAPYELPSQLNIGASYDFIVSRVAKLTVMGNFTSNSFSRDQVGGAVEFSLGQNFSLRAGYKSELDANDAQATLDNGLSGGLSASLPLKKGSDSKLSIDYGYRNTKIYKGIHSIGLRIDL